MPAKAKVTVEVPEIVQGVYYDCPYDDGVPNNGTDCGQYNTDKSEHSSGPRYISVSHAKVVDLISEGGIEGLIHTELKYNTDASTEGDVGWGGGNNIKGVTEQEFIPSYPESGKLCSIYWNETPIMDRQSKKYNFTDIDITTDQSEFRTNGIATSKVRAINEQLRGSQADTTSHQKYYRIYNQDCNKLIINIKVASLGKLDRDQGTHANPNPTYGDLIDSSVDVDFSVRPVYSAKVPTWNLKTVTRKQVVIKGVISQPYMKSVEIPLPLDTARGQGENDKFGDLLGWEVLVNRTTPEPTTPDTKNTTFVDSIVEELEDSMMLPNTFVVSNEFNAEYFSQIPDRAYDMRLQKVRIPSNYDPITKTYHADWDGTFADEATSTGNKFGRKKDNNNLDVHIGTHGGTGSDDRPLGLYWTDNPVWCFHDLLTNKRYGLGKYIDKVTLDKWTLYEIAQYCDQLVDDGLGGLEPRFSCNIILASREDAFQVLNDMASIFRAIIYYASGSVYAVQDSLKDAIFQFNNASVESGDFTYSTTSARVRHTVAIVRYNDKDNFHKPAVEYTDDAEGIRRYGIKEKEVSAFGCTSRGQAIRLGKWILATERLETETISFIAGHEGALLRPGDIFIVSDTNRLINRKGGRITNIVKNSTSEFVVDLDGKLSALDGNRTYSLTLSTPSFFFDPAQVVLGSSTEAQHIRNVHIQKFEFTPSTSTVTYDYNGTGKTRLTIPQELKTDHFSTPEKLSWSVLTTDLEPNDAIPIEEQLKQEARYRVINIAEKEPGQYDIAGAEYREEKFSEIDRALAYTNTVSFQVPLTPNKIELKSISSLDAAQAPNTKVITYDIEPYKNANGTYNKDGLSYFAVYIKKGSNFVGGTIPSDDFMLDRIYSTSNPEGTFIPSTKDDYYFRVYAANSLNEYSSGYKELEVKACPVSDGTLCLGDVKPIRDVRIHGLRMSDNIRANDPGKSDPFSKGTFAIREYDDSTAHFGWQTTIPSIRGINVSFEFKFKVSIYKGLQQGASPDANELIITFNDYRPGDWDLSFTPFTWLLSDNIEETKDANGDYHSEDVVRKYSIRVEAVDDNGDSSADGGSHGYDWLTVDNPEPKKADEDCNPNDISTCLQAFIDINNHIKIFNFTRPADVEGVYLFANDINWTYAEYLSGKITTSWGSPWEANKTYKEGDLIHTESNLYYVVCDNPNGCPSGTKPTHTVDSDGEPITEGGYKWARSAVFAPDVINVDPIASDDPVFELDPTFKTEDLKEAFIAIAYIDQFDKDVLALANLNGETERTPDPFIPYKHFSSRISSTVRCSKVTPEVMDLIGEGWKSWIKIDVEGKWYGRGIRCIEDVTDQYTDGTYDKYKGYVPFYCTRKAPIIDYAGLTSGPSIPSTITLVPITVHHGIEDLYVPSCMYYLGIGKDPHHQLGTHHTSKVNVRGANQTTFDQPATESGTFWDYSTAAANQDVYQGDFFTKGFKRYRIYFDKAKDPRNYWVMGMNVNEKGYFDSDLLTSLEVFVTPQDQGSAYDTVYDSDFKGGAQGAVNKYQNDHYNQGHHVAIGSSDAYFNHHPAGFVQGFGGLPKTVYYFDVHMGHLVDNSYLKEAIFFVMGSTQSQKDSDVPDCPAGDPSTWPPV